MWLRIGDLGCMVLAWVLRRQGWALGLGADYRVMLAGFGLIRGLWGLGFRDSAPKP